LRKYDLHFYNKDQVRNSIDADKTSWEFREEHLGKKLQIFERENFYALYLKDNNIG